MPGIRSFELESLALSSLGRDPMVDPAVHGGSNDERYLSRCQWRGNNFFHDALKAGLASNASVSDRWEDLELKHMQAVVDFPYRNCVDCLDNIKATNIPDSVNKNPKRPFALLVTKLGMLLDEHDMALENKLKVVVQNQGATGSSVFNKSDTLPRVPLTAEEVAVSAGQDISTYSQRLHEWASRRKKGFEYEEKHVSYDPPLWELILRVEGGTFVGEDKNRKRAQHIAAEKACKELKIDGC